MDLLIVYLISVSLPTSAVGGIFYDIPETTGWVSGLHHRSKTAWTLEQLPPSWCSSSLCQEMILAQLYNDWHICDTTVRWRLSEWHQTFVAKWPWKRAISAYPWDVCCPVMHHETLSWLPKLTLPFPLVAMVAITICLTQLCGPLFQNGFYQIWRFHPLVRC